MFLIIQKGEVIDMSYMKNDVVLIKVNLKKNKKKLYIQNKYFIPANVC